MHFRLAVIPGLVAALSMLCAPALADLPLTVEDLITDRGYARMSGLAGSQRTSGVSGTSSDSQSRFADARAGVSGQFRKVEGMTSMSHTLALHLSAVLHG